MPTSNTPLPAAELLRLADEVLESHDALVKGGPAALVDERLVRFRDAKQAYRAARAQSTVTAEERVILNLHRAYESGDPVALQAAFMEFNERARALAEAKKEGGPR